jgi:hypothetical protein
MCVCVIKIQLSTTIASDLKSVSGFNLVQLTKSFAAARSLRSKILNVIDFALKFKTKCLSHCYRVSKSFVQRKSGDQLRSKAVP